MTSKVSWQTFCARSSYSLLGLGILFFSTACDLHFYTQAVSGHLNILNQKRPIADILKDPQTDPQLKQKLELQQHVRQFAMTDLALPESRAYLEYVDLGQSYVSTLVTASEPDALEPYRWWYFPIGYAEYRGYYDAKDAEAYAEWMKQEGWDVAVRKTSAYSTLDWLNKSWIPDYFKDPALNTFVMRSDIRVISTLIHELAHQVVYVSGDTAFNEGFASFVEQEGLRLFLNEHYSAEKAKELYQKHLQQKADSQRFRNLLFEAYEQLQALYHKKLPEKEMLPHKQQIFKDLKANYESQRDQFKAYNYDKWFRRELNNAHLLGVRRYHNYVNAFHAIFIESGENWEAFYDRVKELAQKDESDRMQYLDSRT